MLPRLLIFLQVFTAGENTLDILIQTRSNNYNILNLKDENIRNMLIQTTSSNYEFY